MTSTPTPAAPVPHASAQLVLDYIQNDPELANHLSEPTVIIYNRKKEGYLFAPEIIQIITDLEPKGLKLNLITQDELLASARETLGLSPAPSTPTDEPSPEESPEAGGSVEDTPCEPEPEGEQPPAEDPITEGEPLPPPARPRPPAAKLVAAPRATPPPPATTTPRAVVAAPRATIIPKVPTSTPVVAKATAAPAAGQVLKPAQTKAVVAAPKAPTPAAATPPPTKPADHKPSPGQPNPLKIVVGVIPIVALLQAALHVLNQTHQDVEAGAGDRKAKLEDVLADYAKLLT